jgi:YHS domain-containing protein
MADLRDFARRVEARLKDANREPHWGPDESEQYMAAVREHRERYGVLAGALITEVISPRLEIAVQRFANASPSRKRSEYEAVRWLGYSERFPATTKVSFAVEHDHSFEKIAVCFSASMVPSFIKYNDRDRLTLPIDTVSHDIVAEWVERRLLEFLDSYLRIDRGIDDFSDECTSDPVCGMRIGRSTAAAEASYLGHPYFFCSSECREQFSTNPEAFVLVKGG